MPNPMVMSLSALAALVPISVWSLRSAQTRRDLLFWSLLGAALAGPLAVSVVQVLRPWQTGLSLALWMSIAASILALIAVSLVMREAWRLTPLLAPYLLLMGVAATLWSGAGSSGPGLLHHDIWVRLHIAVSVATYGLCTLAAIAGAAVLLQEHAIKRKRPNALTHKLPSVADALRLQTGLLKASAIILAVGIATGMSGQYLTSGAVLEFDHKTLLSFLAFGTILFLLVLHGRYGLRGQQLARFILLAYLLLTLAYPGVKFVTEVLLAA